MAENVKVAVRVRPFNQREKDRNSKMCIKMIKETQQTGITDPETGKDRMFTFDFSYNSFVPRDDPAYASQDTVWNDIGVGVLKNAYEGFNCSLFAYGQTGAGKSYSMMGYGEDKGIIPMAGERIFHKIDANEDPDLTFRVETSMLEIYMEKVRDLFNPAAGDSLKIRNDPKKGFYIADLSKMAVDNYSKIESLMEAGSKARTVASTNMNATSSRAHTIFQIILTQTKVNREIGKATDKTSLINLIDLAGSERAASTGASGDRLKEGSAINLSLSSLGNCISALAHNSGSKKKKRVPYRDSVLTMLLQNSLGGNAKTIMIAAVSPAHINYDETLGTLRYADRAKQIKNKAVVNEDPNQKMIRNLKNEVAELKKKLAMAGGGEGADVSGMLEEEREKLRKEQEAEVARIKAELEEKMREEMQQGKSWEERLRETEKSTAEQEANLAAMGIVASGDREAAKKRAETEPHISNLNEDEQMSGLMLHFFEPGKSLTFGRKDAATPRDVVLGGLSIQREHCVVECAEDGTLTLIPNGEAKIHFNGDEVAPGERPVLAHLDRLIFGNNHVYVVKIPQQAAAGATIRMQEGETAPEQVTWEFAVMEMNRAQVAAMAEEEARRKAEAEEEARKTAEKMAEIEAKMAAEREAAEKEAEQKRKEFEELEAKLAAQAEEQRKEAAAQGEAAIKAKEEELLKAQQEAKAQWEKEQAKMKKQQEELAAKLKAQIKETERVGRRKQREMRERSLLDEKLLKTIPLVNEANAISDELGKGMVFSVKLMANQSAALREVKQIDTDSEASGGEEEKKGDDDDDEDADKRVLDTEVFVRVEYTTEKRPVSMWVYDKFMGRLYSMREMYTQWVEVGRDIGLLDYTEDTDPFWDPIEAQLIGRSTIYLDSLVYCLGIKEATPIIDYKGKEEGELLVRIIPHTTEKPPMTEEEEDEQECAENIDQLKGQKIGITVCVDSARGLPASRSTDCHVEFRFFLEESPVTTPVYEFKTINPKWEFQHTFWPVVTDELVKYVSTDAIEFEIYGNMDKEGAATAPRPVTAAAKTRQELDELRENLRTAQVERDEALEAREAAEKYKADLRERDERLEKLAAELEAAKKERASKASSPTPGPSTSDADAKRVAQLESQAKQQEEQLAKLRAELEEAKAKSSACSLL